MTAVNIPLGIQHVTGDLSVSLTSSVTTFSAPGLQSIGGTFELLNLTALQSVNAPSLTSVGGINFVILPLLSTMTFGINQAGNIIISDTQLATLDAFSLTSVNDFGISSSPVLNFIDYRQQSLPHDDLSAQFEGSQWSSQYCRQFPQSANQPPRAPYRPKCVLPKHRRHQLQRPPKRH